MDKSYTDDVAYFCPQCGSPALDFSILVGGEASCRSCDWEGTKGQLACSPIKHHFSSPEDMVVAITTDLRNTLTSNEFAVHLGRFLLKWGFIEHPINRDELVRYIKASVKAIFEAITQTREEIIKERHGRH